VGVDDEEDIGAVVSGALFSSGCASVGWQLGEELREGSTLVEQVGMELEAQLEGSADRKVEGYPDVRDLEGLGEGVSLSLPHCLHEHFAMFGRNQMSSSSMDSNSAGQKPTLVPSMNW
jgi:hypothetical protein